MRPVVRALPGNGYMASRSPRTPYTLLVTAKYFMLPKGLSFLPPTIGSSMGSAAAAEPPQLLSPLPLLKWETEGDE